MTTATARRRALGRALIFLGLVGGASRADGGDPPRPAAAAAPVSFDKQVRPIFRARCQGCHQPAKAGGGYVMTDFARLRLGGESHEPAVVPGQPAASHLVAQVAPGADGTAAMPPKGPALAAGELDLVRRWVAEGAVDDSPPADRPRYDRDHPPTYTRPPVVAALDYSPDGRLLAVGGFNEVLVWRADGSELVARLVGLSERVESVRFSPDGKRLAVAGGLPCRMGEVQVWDVATGKLTLSTTATGDTLGGASWSPDGARIAFGGHDNAVRAIDAATGEQVLFMGSHADWALGTAFVGADHLVSVGRDMAAKLTELATQRFVDNVTSITPGALKGGLAAVVRYPGRDEVIVGGADGVPKLYRAFRETERKIGDDANLIAALGPMPGRIFGVAVGGNGRVLAAASSLDRRGQVDIHADAFDPVAAPDPIRATLAKPGKGRSAEERAALDKYRQGLIRRVAAVANPGGALYAVAASPDGTRVAAAGAEGIVRLLDAATGRAVAEFCPVPLAGSADPIPTDPAPIAAVAPAEPAPTTPEPPSPATVAALEVRPTSIDLDDRSGRVQLVVTAVDPEGRRTDVTRSVALDGGAGIVRVARSGQVEPLEDGATVLRVALGGKVAEIPVRVGGMATPVAGDYVRDVTPILSKLGCNMGTCHGSAQGKNGFKLSLRGYDPIFDIRALTDDHAARRVNLAAPVASLMLLKATGAVPHAGGTLIRRDDPAYATLLAWITAGARLDPGTPKVARIAVEPVDPVVEAVGARQQLRVVATYADGRTRDVTREAFTESGNIEVAAADKSGLMTALRRGEAPILVRYEGAYAATTLTVMGDRAGFTPAESPSQNRIDELVAAKWQRLKIRPSEPCTDAEFLRRVRLDLTGLPPTADEVRAFLADPSATATKRDALIARLIGSPEFVDHWTNKWADLLQVNRKFLGTTGAAGFRAWIRDQVAANVPHDRFVRTLLTATGSNRTNPASDYVKILREPTALMENTTQLFLGVRFNCNKCHDHPFERWTQDQYYELSASFARVGLKRDPESGERKIGGTEVEAAVPLFEEVYDKADGEVVHDRTKQVAPPKFPFACGATPSADTATRREALASWITAPDNPYFARSQVNRLWGYLFGVGIIEPIDDIRAGNPASNPELLDYLTREFIDSGFDTRHIIGLICRSRTYGLAVAANRWNEDDKTNFSHAIARRLPAEVLLDAVYRTTGSTSAFPGVAPGTRAAALPDSGVELPSGFLATFGRPVRESACECERSAGLQLGPVMALLSGPTLGDAIADPANELARLVAREPDDRQLVEELFLRILNRPATPGEVATCLADLGMIDADGTALAASARARASEVAADLPARDEARRAAIASAQGALAAYDQAHAETVAAAEQARVATVARLEADLKGYEAAEPDRIAAWERTQSPLNRWRTLVPTSAVDTGKATLTVQPDGAVLVSGALANGTTTVVAETDLPRITGLRLEVLADPTLPAQGPGRAANGNFVLNALQVTAAPKGKPNEARPVVLRDAQADFNQPGFDIRTAVDGAPGPNKGWAVAGATGRGHWATFTVAEPTGFAEGTILTVAMTHQYPDGTHIPGKFRLAASATPGPVGLDLSAELQAVISTAPEVRTPAQVAALVAYRRPLDAPLAAQQVALAEARRPLPIPPERQALRARLAEAELPIPPDARLAQLQRDADLAARQAEARRLTAAQDIAWALINSPSFLFNH